MANALITVVLCEAEGGGGGQFDEGAIRVVSVNVLSTGQSGIQQPSISQSRRAAEGSEALLVEQEESLSPEPSRRAVHFASTLKVSR